MTYTLTLLTFLMVSSCSFKKDTLCHCLLVSSTIGIIITYKIFKCAKWNSMLSVDFTTTSFIDTGVLGILL